ncbi:MAG: flagellar basal body-associated FliL family protein [Oleiphilaceae bacterium]|nr:flagellar basal body-associated FliL family protein [Oleiphilaceae bacterium]
MAEETAPEGKKKGKLKTLILLGVVGLLAVALSVGATLFFLGDSDAPEKGAGEEAEAVEEQPTPADYYEFEEAFVVTLSDERQRYLQVRLAVVMRGEDVSAQLEAHNPTLRSRIQSVLASQSFSELREEQGREALRQSIAETINQVMEEESSAGVEQVLYTNFVMQ